MESCLLIDRRDGYAIVTLNRPQALNALSRDLLAAISSGIDELEADPAIRAIVLTGAGRAFCAGMDLKELAGDESPLADAGGLWSEASINPVSCLARFSGPIVAAVNGAAVTGGFEIALACDIIVASTSARFADTHARVGIIPGGGVSQKLSRVLGIYRAKEMSLTGRFISAEQAEQWGLVNRVVSPDDLLATAESIVADMLSIDDEMLKSYKRLIDEGFARPFGDGMILEEETARTAAARISAADVRRGAGGVMERGRTSEAEANRRQMEVRSS